MLNKLYDLQIPDELQEVAIRHQRHVADLVSQLRSAGMDDNAIERGVDQLIASYRAELVEAIKALRGFCRGR